jgi:hypothetical protein
MPAILAPVIEQLVRTDCPKPDDKSPGAKAVVGRDPSNEQVMADLRS